MIVGLEWQYQNKIQIYKAEYTEAIEIEHFDELNSSWKITNNFYNAFGKTYGRTNISLMNRDLVTNPNSLISLGLNPFFSLYLFVFNGYNKLIIIINEGNCGEFAAAVTSLIKDVTGNDTRMVQVEGADHAFPEINIMGDWWVFDKTYTTSEKPVLVDSYANYVKSKDTDLFDSIADLKIIDTKKSVLKEHGFFPSNIIIRTLFDTIDPNLPDISLPDVNIEIYALKFQRDPLVFSGDADEYGNCSLILNGNKKYLIIGKLGTSQHQFYGFNITDISPFKDEIINLYLY